MTAVAEPGGEATRVGQLVHLRAVSRKLAFGDLEVQEGGGTVRLVFKAWTDSGLTVEDLHYVRCIVKLGDTLRVTGRSEDGEACTSILVTRVAVVAVWKEHHPGVTFQPRPSSLPAGRTRGVGNSSSKAVCKYFLNTGRCALQEACPFAHEHGAAASALWVAQRKQSRRLLAAEAGNMHACDGGGMHVKAHRAEVFANWLIATFGKPAMCSSGGVLDVAGGGSGGLAFALSVLHGVPVQVVDPRPVHVSALQRKRAAENNVVIPAAFPDQVALWFEEATWYLAEGKALLVGMHPDQATDSIFDAALQLGIPFAVVPCCVFPSLLAASRGVRLSSRDQLVAYLLAKRPGEICIDWLPVDGAAQVLYWRGPRSVVAAAMRVREPPWWDERATSAID